MQETPSFVNAVNVGLVTSIIQHNRTQGVFLLCKITNLLIYSIENRILGSMEYFYDGLDSSGRPQYTVKASMTSNPLKLKSSKLVTRAEGVNSWHTNEEDHNGYTGTNSRSYVYTTPNPPSNPYCEAILTATDEKGDEYAVWKGTLRDAK